MLLWAVNGLTVLEYPSYSSISCFSCCIFLSFTVQFDGVEKSRMSPTKEGKTRPLQRHSSGCLVNTKMTSLDHCSSSLGERIDPTMPLESQLWVRVVSLLWLHFIWDAPLVSFCFHVSIWPVLFHFLCSAFLYFFSFLIFISCWFFFFWFFSVAGTTERSAGQMQSLCSGCARRRATWWETARPARTTTPSPSSKTTLFFRRYKATDTVVTHTSAHDSWAKE